MSQGDVSQGDGDFDSRDKTPVLVAPRGTPWQTKRLRGTRRDKTPVPLSPSPCHTSPCHTRPPVTRQRDSNPVPVSHACHMTHVANETSPCHLYGTNEASNRAASASIFLIVWLRFLVLVYSLGNRTFI